MLNQLRSAYVSRYQYVLRALVVVPIVCALLIPIARPAIRPSAAAVPVEVQYGDISFDPSSTKWTLAENGETLLFLPTARSLANQGKLRVGPTRPAPANINAVREQIWARLAAGQTVQGSYYVNEGAINYGGNHPNANAYYHRAYFSSGACAGVMIVEANRKITPFEMTLDTKNACYVLMDTFDFIMETLKVKAGGSVPPARVGPGFNVGTPTDQGPDPYDSIDWDGPDELGYGIYDIHPIHPKNELQEAMLLGGDFIGSVQPRELTFADALAHVRLLLDSPKTKAEYDKLKNQIHSSDPFMLQGVAFTQVIGGEPLSALLSLLAAYELYPNDSESLLNLAAMLAHCGMPNESLAVLKEMEKRGIKPQPAGLSPDALIEYLKGFNQLLIGQTETAKGHLHQAITLDPFLKEASLALAVAQKKTGESEEAEKTYYQGVWRRRPSQYLLCGGTGKGNGKEDPDNPYVRPPITDMLDVSRGSPGVLPQFDHPTNYAKALGLKDRYERTIMQTKDESFGFAQQSVAIGRRLSARKKTAIEAWSSYIDLLISTLDVQEPAMKKLLAAKQKAQKEAEQASVRIAQQALRMAMPLMDGKHNSELQAIANDAVGAMRPYAQAYDLAVRRYHRTWYRFATGLAAHLGDKDWHQKEVLGIRVTTNANWASLVAFPIGWYAGVAAVAAITGKDPSGDAARTTHGEVPECPEDMKDREFKVGLKIPLGEESIEFNLRQACDVKTIEVGYNALDLDIPSFDASLGAFAQAEIARKGNTTIFVGVKGDAGVKGFGGTGRAGVYVTGDGKGEIVDFGVRATAEAETRLGEKIIVAGSRTFQDAKISFVPSFPDAARGPNLRE